MTALRGRMLDWWEGAETHWSDRRRAPYDIRTSRTVERLEREVTLLDAIDAVVELDVKSPGDLKLNGFPRAGVTMVSPKVALTVTTRNYGTLRFQADRWDFWAHNLRSIGLVLERLRLVDEAGVSGAGRQYQGFLALPAASTASQMSSDGEHRRREAVATLIRHAGHDVAPMDPDDVLRRAGADEQIKALTRAAVRNTHPDVGGDRGFYAEVDAAVRTLRAQ